jgi:hypothetical protein
MGWSGRAPAPPASEAGKGLNDFPSDVVELAQRTESKIKADYLR